MSEASSSETHQLLDEVRRVGDLSQSAFSKILSLSDEVAQLKQQLGASAFRSTPQAQRLRVFFGCSHLERKPYSVSMSGALEGTVNVSPVRAAILLVGFVDLQDRAEGGRGVSGFVSAVVRVLRRLEKREVQDGLLAESVRVALYRFEEYLHAAPEFRNKSSRLSYQQTRERFRFVPDDLTPRVDVSSDTPVFAELINELFTTSPLERLRRTKAMYLPPGPRGLDKLLLEMYDHEHPLKVQSVYFRPASISCPRELLEHSGASPNALRRHELALEGMASGRVEFLEILQEESIRDLTRKNAAGDSPYYSFTPSDEQILSHLDHLIWRVKNLAGYQLVITRSSLPTYLVTYELRSGITPEFFSVCCRHEQEHTPGADLLSDLAVYCINDQVITELLSSYTVDWICRHPASRSDRSSVLEILAGIRGDFLSGA